jgi:protein-arginine kinase activator protein McsA
LGQIHAAVSTRWQRLAMDVGAIYSRHASRCHATSMTLNMFNNRAGSGCQCCFDLFHDHFEPGRIMDRNF